MLNTFIFDPIFNLLVFIYAVLPGHDFGVAIVIFTVFIRFAMWPLLKKQLHQSRLMRKIQPEITKLKKQHKGNRQAESAALMELYKRHGVNPFSSIGLLIVQLPVFIGLFQALRALLNEPEVLAERTYGAIQNLPHMETVLADLSKFDTSFLGFVDMTDHAYSSGTIVVPALIIALLAGVFQFFQIRQLSPAPDKKKKKGIRQILKDSKDGKEPDMSELNAATASKMTMIMPLLITFIAASSPAGLALYFATGGLTGFLQQRYVLGQDVKEMEDMKMTTTVKTQNTTKKKKTPRKSKKG